MRILELFKILEAYNNLADTMNVELRYKPPVRNPEDMYKFDIYRREFTQIRVALSRIKAGLDGDPDQVEFPESLSNLFEIVKNGRYGFVRRLEPINFEMPTLTHKQGNRLREDVTGLYRDIMGVIFHNNILDYIGRSDSEFDYESIIALLECAVYLETRVLKLLTREYINCWSIEECKSQKQIRLHGKSGTKSFSATL